MKNIFRYKNFKMNIFPYSRQIISSADIKTVSRVLRSDFITQVLR